MSAENYLQNSKQQNREEQDTENDTRCGASGCRPNGIQCFANLLAFAFVYGATVLVTQALSVYTSSQITTLERQFDLTSTDSGIIMSCNDIGFLTTILFMSHYGPRWHIPRVIAAGAFLFGLSGVVSSLPHFIIGGHMNDIDTNKPNHTNTFDFCGNENLYANSSNKCSEHDKETASAGSKWIVVYLGLCLVAQGIGKTPRSSLGTAYLDSSVDKTRTGIYLGISTTMGLLGPFLALMLGGVFGKIPVDLRPTSITPRDPRWIGAWWIGFLLFGILGILFSFPVALFPRRMKTSIKESTDGESQESERDNQNKKEPNKKPEKFLEELKGLPRALCRIFGKPVYSLNVLGLMVLLFGVMGASSFGPKYIENQFNVPTWKANMILGGEKIVTGTIGTFMGGYLTFRLKLGRQGCLKMIAIIMIITTSIENLFYIFGCQNPTIHGFQESSEVTSAPVDTSCICTSASYFPVCGSNGQSYFSPCHAGCRNETNNEFEGCSISAGAATPGICDTGCPYLTPYVATSVISTVIGTLCILPIYLVSLRTVDEQDKALAMGMNSFMMALFVFLPAPVVFGKLFDGTCLVWNQTCGVQGACKLYDIEVMRFTFVSMEVGLRALSLIIYICAFFVGQREIKLKKVNPKEKEIPLKEIL